MLPISERMAMAISITNDIICAFLPEMILFWTCIRDVNSSIKLLIFDCSASPGIESGYCIIWLLSPRGIFDPLTDFIT